MTTSQPTSGRRHYAYIATAVIIAAALVSGTIAVVSPTLRTTVTKTETSTETTSQNTQPQLLGSHGVLDIQGVGPFYYTEDNRSIPLTFTYRNVTFSLITGRTYTGGTCAGYTLTFQDGSTENLTACSTPFDFPTVFVFAQHKSSNGNPAAGLAMSPNGSLYFLVSWP